MRGGAKVTLVLAGAVPPAEQSSGKLSPPLELAVTLVRSHLKLQALVYDILPSATAVFSYAIGSRTLKLSANEHFCCWCSNSMFVTNNSDYIRRLFYN